MNKIKVNKLFNDSDIPAAGGVYIYSLINKGICVYVGQSVCVKTRMYQHLLNGKEFDSIEFEMCETENKDTAELEMIIKRQPTLNKILPNNDKYISMTALSDQITTLLFENTDSIPFAFVGAENESHRKTKRYMDKKVVLDIKNAIIKTLIPECK